MYLTLDIKTKHQINFTMPDARITLGMPDTLPPLGRQVVLARLWLAFCGLLLLTISFFPMIIPGKFGAYLFLVCWLALPAKDFFQRFRHGDPEMIKEHADPRVRLYLVVSGVRNFWLIYCAVVVMGAIAMWWIPYFRGTDQKTKDRYAKMCAGTIQVLPPRGDNPRPNLFHVVLHSLGVSALILATVIWR